MKIKITADSTCDLSKELIQKYNIEIIPLYIIKEEHAYKDDLEIKPDDIFQFVKSGKGICKTAAVNIADYIDCFKEQLNGYDALIHINIGTDFSSCHPNALTAAKTMDGVYVVDSRNLSTGSGQIVICAAEMAMDGKEPEEICHVLETMTEKVETSFIIDTLEYLKKGGRCSTLTALGANMLKIKPCIEVLEGKMKVGKKYRGSFERCVRQYAEDRLNNRGDIDKKRIFITHSGCDRELIHDIRKMVQEYADPEEILETNTGCTVSNHCGPNTLGIVLIRK